jgi:hypothetical protein
MPLVVVDDAVEVADSVSIWQWQVGNWMGERLLSIATTRPDCGLPWKQLTMTCKSSDWSTIYLVDAVVMS